MRTRFILIITTIGNYISRACGFITTYDIQDIIIKNDSENWILNTEIIETNIIDEKNIHVKIFH